jgi:hypothetical protein
MACLLSVAWRRIEWIHDDSVLMEKRRYHGHVRKNNEVRAADGRFFGMI